ncbi:ParB/RepB/Spo0J family partition protein [Acinetobacter radioresistens]|uniref:ParB/RepB/Spo0J family partition protein n=1 Tax=Acinetobacter radioresistens TaxID=40216 RepID=UPI0021CD5D10|nr:ParB/RepB/Spo0J family partition protein [Acinetobacter radioresistens]MCU4596646.1 ParB/RepB/Spo0J family partition protein [Acinetobacter radioresistens]
MTKENKPLQERKSSTALGSLSGANFGNLVGKKASSNAKKENLLIKMDLIEEDPLNVRTIFNELQLEQLAESIKENGVLTPISVRDNPEKPGHYIINNGARRFRASQIAQQDTIPAFIDNSHDELNQMIDNIQREDLSIIEIAEKIKKLLAPGDLTKSALAKRAGKPPAWISKHLNALQMPPRLKLLYDLGQCNDLEAINTIVNRWDDHGAEIQKWLETFEGTSKLVTQAGVRKFFKSLDEKQEKQQKEKELSASQIDIEEEIQTKIQADEDDSQNWSASTADRKADFVVTTKEQEIDSIGTNESVSPQCFNEDLSVEKTQPGESDAPTSIQAIEVDFTGHNSTIEKASKVLSVLKNIDELQPILKDENRYISLKVSLLKGTDDESRKQQSKVVSKLLAHLEDLRKEFPTLDLDISF